MRRNESRYRQVILILILNLDADLSSRISQHLSVFDKRGTRVVSNLQITSQLLN
jgi:hypothetical protein